jgi:sRNA-binding regulator protein Hfq
MEKIVLENYKKSVAGKSVNVYLKSGTMLSGKIDDVDDFCLILDKTKTNCLVFLDSIISIKIPENK